MPLLQAAVHPCPLLFKRMATMEAKIRFAA